MAPLDVLVATDDARLRRSIVDALRKDGYRVQEAANPSAVQKFFERGENDAALVPDVLVSDFQAHARAGIDLLREILRRNLPTRVILVAARGDVDTHHDARRLGAAEILERPFAVDALRRAVASLARER